MGQSYRIQTELGINKTINVQLDQEFEFLEILSLKIQQSDIYTRSCADYGVLVGRVTANGGFGLPNARVSIFIPIDSIDQSNPLIQSIYPYKSPSDKNSDGYRYNLLPYEKSYSKHAATGTLPSRNDVLTASTVVEIYDKYYKFTAKTNESGDYMIMGVPLGEQTLVMDVDLSDIGEFSLTPQDLIRMGLATEAQVAGNQFRTSTDINSLPQIINLSVNTEISPLWGDPDLCQIAINRVDFDLRDSANIDIQPTSTFMGSIYSTSDAYRVRRNCKPRDNMGNLCSLAAGPGQILAIRQTVQQDSDGNPILELYQLEQAGNIIDGSGVWLTELPMNLDYIITNQFGEKVISNNPTIGIPTKAKYRFKIKWQQPAALTTQTRRPNYLVPNIKEYGPDITQLKSSYYFGLAWSGYTNGFTGTKKINRLNEAIDCEDTFYEFKFNKVYTVSGLIDEYKKGAKGRFIGIKEIDSSDCESTINKFPVNDGFRNFDLLFFIFSILMTLITPLALAILFAMHLVLWIYLTLINALCFICNIDLGLFGHPFAFICNGLGIDCAKKRDYSFKLPMITYPECQACDCKQSAQIVPINNSGGPTSYLPTGILTYLSSTSQYQAKFEQYYSASTAADIYNLAQISSQSVAGFGALAVLNDPSRYKVPYSQTLTFSNGNPAFAASKSLPIGERINLFNQRSNFFTGLNSVKVSFASDSNINKFHLDNTITVLSNTQFSTGDLLSAVSITGSTDINWTYTADTVNGLETGISGETYNGGSATTINVTYAISQYTNSQSIKYNLPYGSETINYKYPADIEYFQVITAITIADAAKIWNSGTTQSFPNVMSTPIDFSIFEQYLGPYREKSTASVTVFDTFDNIENQYILILQRGVDPYSPKYKNVYSLGKIFGGDIDDPNFIVTADTRVNIPIQALNNQSSTIQDYSINDMYYQSYFFKPGISGSTSPGGLFTGFNTTNLAYYGAQSSLLSLSSQEDVLNSAVVSKTSNGFYDVGANSAKYDNSEDVSGLSFIQCNDYGTILSEDSTLIPGLLQYYYYTPSLFSPINTVGSTLLIDNNVNNIVRTDRLPTSDILDGGSFSTNPSILQQNNAFTFYLINEDSKNITTSSNTFGASQVTPDLGDLPGVTNVLESFNCENMVALGCYEGLGNNFQVNQQCTEVDPVENGCYVFMKNPANLTTIEDDFATYAEWSFRFRFFYGLCRGVLSQSFMNNWVSGSLYMFPIQVDTRYNNKNQAYSRYCSDLVYFESETNNFYYRSSPYDTTSNKFVGIPAPNDTSVNKRNLLFPTTIMNLGMKDYFYQEITFNPETKGYVMPNLDSTSYGDTSDLVNLFVISRITDEGFLRQIIVVGDNSLNQLFSRNEKRIDGDLAQLLSINSEDGVIKFSPEYYETVQGSTTDPVNILGTSLDPVMCVWFSSTTNDIQFKDYLTPGRIDFRTNDNTNYYPYPYGIKSQVTPFYQWKLANTTTIFGSQMNSWATDLGDIVQNKRFQSLDRTSLTQPNYFRPSTSSVNDLYARGYIFSVDSNGVYSTVGATSDKFIVGAPFHFYFGTIKGETALDKFKTKYSIIE
jgi:hypothetical protein